MRPLKLDVIGFGNVGRAFVKLMSAKRDQLPFKVVSLITARHGWWADPTGIDLKRAFALKDLPSKDPPPRISHLPGNVLVELTTLDARTGEPATSHIREALRAGKHVVTANKGPIALHWPELRDVAFAVRREIRFEATLSDCLPVFNLERAALPLADIRRIRGIVSSTNNHILSSAARGVPFRDALAEAQRLGIAEADPRNDLEGWDAAVKATILANVLMDGAITPADVSRHPITEETCADAARAAADGARIRPIIEIERRPSKRHAHHFAAAEIRTRFGPRRLEPMDPLYAVDGLSMALELETDLAGTIVVQLHDPHMEQVAYAVLADLIDIASR